MCRLSVILMLLFISIFEVQAGILYPYGNQTGDSKAYPPGDDVCYGPYDYNITMFGKTSQSLYVCSNGLISFDRSFTAYSAQSFPLTSSIPIICPFWTDVELTYTGNLWIGETTDPKLLQNVSQEVREANTLAVNNSYSATWMLVCTWEDVPAYGHQQQNFSVNTFQAAIVSDGITSAAIFNYEEINWTFGSANTNVPAQVGFDAGDGENFYSTPSSVTPEVINITAESNVGIPGRMIFILDTLGGVAPPTSERPGPEETSERPGPGETSERSGLEEIFEQPGPRETSERPGPEETSERVGPEKAFKRPGPGETHQQGRSGTWVIVVSCVVPVVVALLAGLVAALVIKYMKKQKVFNQELLPPQ